jgi:hypothetical protein
MSGTGALQRKPELRPSSCGLPLASDRWVIKLHSLLTIPADRQDVNLLNITIDL